MKFMAGLERLTCRERGGANPAAVAIRLPRPGPDRAPAGLASPRAA
jgi:hypothetical protein